MAMNKHLVTYTSTNSYETLNELTPKTKNVWFVLHGMGYLSRYFLKHFKSLNPDDNYIICPQAPSKYYLKDAFKHVGASWLTKEDTLQETENVLTYLDAVMQMENIPNQANLILFGFSQGVSIAMRWLTRRKISCSKLVLYAGGIPNEIKPEHLDFIDYQKNQIQLIYGDSDEYISAERLNIEKNKIELLFGNNAEVIHFEGGHEIKLEILQAIST